MKRHIYRIIVVATMVFISCKGHDTRGGENFTERGSGSDTTTNENSLKHTDSTGKHIDTSQATLPTDTAPYKRNKEQ